MNSSSSSSNRLKKRKFQIEAYKCDKEEVDEEYTDNTRKILQHATHDVYNHNQTRLSYAELYRMTEVKMAYTGVISILKNLGDLLQIPLKLLNIKKLHAKLFIKKVGEILRMLEMEGTTTLPEKKVKMILSLALPIENVPEQSWLRRLRSGNGQYILTTDNPWMVLAEAPEIVQEINFITETHLERFLDDTDFYNNWEDFRNNLGLLVTRKAVRNLIQAGQELKEGINFFHEIGTETNALFQYLNSLLTLLMEPDQFSNECHGEELVKGISDVVNKARSSLDCCPNRVAWEIRRSFSENPSLFYDKSAEVKKNYNRIEEAAKNLFEGKHGMRLVLLETLGKLDSFKGDVNMICEKLGREYFQSWNAPIIISQPWSPSVNVWQGMKIKSIDLRRKKN